MVGKSVLISGLGVAGPTLASRWGLFLRNRIINAAAIPGFARIAFGSSIVDSLRLPEYSWEKSIA
jgi:hypothetical protein